MHKSVIIVSALSLLVLGGCAPTQDYNTLQNQVTQQNQTIQQLNMQLSGVQPAQADTWSQVQGLRQEMAALRGQVDTLNHALTQVGGAQAMAETLARHDRALRLIETQLALDLQLTTAAVPGAMPGSVPGAATGTLGGADTGLAPSVAPGTTMTTPPTSAITPPPAAANPAKPAATADTAQALYDTGMKAFNDRRYPQALTAFTDFTKTYGDHNLVSNAWFWQGESNYQMKNYAAAALAYEQVISKYANSNKGPASYLKQGMSFLQLKKKDAAKERLNQLITKFPKAPEAIRAKQVLAENP